MKERAELFFYNRKCMLFIPFSLSFSGGNLVNLKKAKNVI